MFSWNNVRVLSKISLGIVFALIYIRLLCEIPAKKPDAQLETCPAPDRVFFIDHFKKDDPEWIKCPVSGQHLTLHRELYSTFVVCTCDNK